MEYETIWLVLTILATAFVFSVFGLAIYNALEDVNAKEAFCESKGFDGLGYSDALGRYCYIVNGDFVETKQVVMIENEVKFVGTGSVN